MISCRITGQSLRASTVPARTMSGSGRSRGCWIAPSWTKVPARKPAAAALTGSRSENSGCYGGSCHASRCDNRRRCFPSCGRFATAPGRIPRPSPTWASSRRFIFISGRSRALLFLLSTDRLPKSMLGSGNHLSWKVQRRPLSRSRTHRSSERGNPCRSSGDGRAVKRPMMLPEPPVRFCSVRRLGWQHFILARTPTLALGGEQAAAGHPTAAFSRASISVASREI